MAINKTKTNKVSFEENLTKIITPSESVPTSALYALSNMTPEHQAAFEMAWDKLEAERRRKIVNALNDLAEQVVELNFDSILNLMLHDQDEEVRGRAVEGLWEDESRPMLAELLKLLENDPSAFVREKAAIGLSRFAYLAELERLSPRWIERLSETLLAQVNNPKNTVEVHRRLVEALGYFNKNEQVIKIIEKAYLSEDELLKASAIRAMGRHINSRWIPELGKEMNSPVALFRYEAATAVGEMSSTELLPTLLKLTEDEDLEVRLAAILSLGQIGGPQATNMLKFLLKDEKTAVRSAAQEALREIGFITNPINPLSGEL